MFQRITLSFHDLAFMGIVSRFYLILGTLMVGIFITSSIVHEWDMNSWLFSTFEDTPPITTNKAVVWVDGLHGFTTGACATHANTSVRGYIVSVDETRYNNSKKVLEDIGLEPHPYYPFTYDSKEVRQSWAKFQKTAKGSPKFVRRSFNLNETIWRHKLWSNRLAFLDLLQNFVDDKSVNVNTWRFFFEDDIAIHPNTTVAEVRQAIQKGMKLATNGAMYLGICFPEGCTDRLILSKSIVAHRCFGLCAHAFGLTKWKAHSILAFVKKETSYSNYVFDVLLNTYGRGEKIWTLGTNLLNPCPTTFKKHAGMIFQNQDQYPSFMKGDWLIKRKNRGFFRTPKSD